VNDEELLRRYLQTFHLSEAAVTLEDVKHHFALEKQLTRDLLASSQVERWETFERCYTELYQELPWLAKTGGDARPDVWARLVGRPGSSVYEVGSGAGQLATALSSAGYRVTATDVSRNRGHRAGAPNLQWQTTDGVHLDRFAAANSFDAVVSDQLIEHLHPADVFEHLRSAYMLLRPGGRYIFATPHRLTGPHDVSRVFGEVSPVGMHLMEYTNSELSRLARDAGFAVVRSVLWIPRLSIGPFASRSHLRLLRALEGLLSRLPQRYATQLALRMRGPVRLDVFLVAERSPGS
jgi:2-polyprenyl-3-methyl-5-hydroxy-6-metoxy-1,4-benzoquinol methylase